MMLSVTKKLSCNNVFQYLIDTGIYQNQNLYSMIIEPYVSNNFNVIINVLNSRKLIVKQECFNYDGNTTNKIRNEWQFYNFLQSCPDLGYASSLNSEVLHFDESNSILIYKYPTDYIDLESYYRNQKLFPITIAELVGTTLAALHRETFNSRNCYNFINEAVEGNFFYQLPYTVYLQDRLKPETFFNLPPESYKFIGFYQRHESLRAAVKKLVFAPNYYCLTHNNPQLNNILISPQWERLLFKTKESDESIIRLINVENYSWGDPAFDLGTVIASYLLLWLNSLIVHPAIELNKSLQLATIPLEVIQPSIVVLTKSYINNFPKVLEDYPDFTTRVLQFTGLALIYRVITMLQSFKGFNNVSSCMLQLAKNMLCQPEKSFKSVFGITEVALIELTSL